MICTNCGKAQADSAAVCGVCGAQLATPSVRHPEAQRMHPTMQRRLDARIITPKVGVHRDADMQSTLITDLMAGDEVALGKTTQKQGKRWVQVNLHDGRRGYMPGDTEVFAYRKARLLERAVASYEQPSSMAAAKLRYKKGAEFEIIDSVETDDAVWIKIRDLSGNEGFIKGRTRIRTLMPGCDEAYGRGNMICGAIWCIGGIAVTVGTRAAAGPDGVFVVAWGAILFGFIQFLRGLFQHIGQENELAKKN